MTAKYPYIIDCASIDGDTLDGAALKADGCEGIVARAELGDWLDTDFAKHRDAAHKAGLMFGAYLYPNWSKPIEREARSFFDVIGKLGPGHFPPCIDIEEGDTRKGPAFNGMPPEAVRSKWVEFLRLVQVEYGGIRALSYTSARVIREGLRGIDVSPLDPLTDWWLTPYSSYFTPPPLPPHIDVWALHQFKGDAPNVPGVKGRVDLSRWNPALGDMRAYYDAMWARECTAVAK